MNSNENIGVEELKTIFQNLPVGISVGYIDEDTGSDMVLLMINDRICQIIGYSKREITEKFKDRFSSLIAAKDKQRYQEAIFDLYEFPHSKTIGYILRRKDGESVYVKDKMQSVRQADGSMRVYSCIAPEYSGQEIGKEKCRVEIKTFDTFEVLVDGQPMVFRSDKAKELLALLVDRRGSYVSNREIITHLWEDKLVDDVVQAKCRKTVYNLKNTLKIYGVEDIVESKMKGYRRLVMDKVNCDLYHYLSGEEKYADLFQGVYLEEYYWAETTLTKLLYEE